MNRPAVLLLLLVFMAFLLQGCPQQSQSDYVSEKIGKGESASVLGSIIKEWRILSIVFVLLSIGLVSLAYPISSAFNMPDLRAWADVELSEAFTTVLIVIAVMAVLIFVELVTQGILLNSPEFTCEPDTYCPVSVAGQYIEDYLGKTMTISDDLMKSAIMAGKLATMSVVFGTNYLWLGYASFSMKVAPEYMIEVTTLTQQMQFLMGMREALIYQQFLLNHISNSLAPMALLLGIVFRSFFITRKLGGLLMAFGIGFLLVFPASYALAFYTLQTTLYGSSTTGGDVSNEFCTESCRQMPPVAYNENTYEPYTRSNLTRLFPQNAGEGDKEYSARIEAFIAGEADTKEYSSVARANIISCTDGAGADYDSCPADCRSLPYPNTNPACASRYSEYRCREKVHWQCFVTRYADMDDPALQGLMPEDNGADCPLECRPVPGLKREGCDVGNGALIPDEETVEELKDDNYQNPQVNGTYVTEWACPNECRWITTEGRMGEGCKQYCKMLPAYPQSIWDKAKAAHERGDLQGQIDAAEETCYMIVPADAMTDPNCVSCSYLMDPGFASYPPVHQRCDNLCGKAKLVGVSKDSGRDSAVDGFSGPAETKSITKLVVPAIILPLFNLAITFMFIRTLSPMLGGDVDIPGMAAMIK